MLQECKIKLIKHLSFRKHNDPVEKQITNAEIKFTDFLAEHNLPVAVADHSSPLVKDTQESAFSICTDGSNDQNLEKMTPVAFRIFDINQHTVLTKFLDMWLSRSSTASATFSSINDVSERCIIPWTKCVSHEVDNTSVNIGKHKPLIVGAGKELVIFRKKATSGFEEEVGGFDVDVEPLLVDSDFHFDSSPC